MELSYRHGPDDLCGRGAVVVGGGRGIGRAIALRLAQAGATVAVVARTRSEGEATVAAIADGGGRASFHLADVRIETEIAAAIEAATVAVGDGGLEIAVNGAGRFAGGELHELDEHDWEEILAVNLTGTWLALKHELRHMRPRGRGAIVNIASNLGAHAARPGVGAYAAAKAGVAALGRVAALEAIADGIRVNTVSPGPISTPMSRRPGETDAERDARVAATLPIGRIGDPDEVAEVVRWLVSPAASLLVGHDVVLDGGLAAT